jgi:hypothetical protein
MVRKAPQPDGLPSSLRCLWGKPLSLLTRSLVGRPQTLIRKAFKPVNQNGKKQAISVLESLTGKPLSLLTESGRVLVLEVSMNRLQQLRTFYQQYFVEVRYTPKGSYWCQYERIWHDIEQEGICLSKPGNDWSLWIEDHGDHFEARLGESWSGGELFRFCFKDIDALLELLEPLQVQVEAMFQYS